MIIGIDLGTTFSLGSYVNQKGLPVLCPAGKFPAHRAFQTPSVVHIGSRGCFVGDLVEALLDDDPSLSVARFAKLAMGNKQVFYEDHEGFGYTAEAISSLVLRKVRFDAEHALGETVTGAVITVPAHFNEGRRKATVQAAQLANLPVLSIVEEPLAAAVYFGMDAKKSGEQTIFVFDLGGGTLDATILQATPDGLFAIATEGADNIGGKNFDELIMDVVKDHFEASAGRQMEPSAENLQKIRAFATDAKIALSESNRGVVTRPILLNGRPLNVTLTRSQFETLTEPWLEACELVCDSVMRAASLRWSDIDDLVLTGGSSLLPSIVSKVHRMSGLPEGRIRHKQPHASVAYGAALLAQQLEGKGESIAPPLKQTVSSNELGVRIFDTEQKKVVFHPMIEKNVPLPVSHRQTVFTRSPEQNAVSIEVVQRKDLYSPVETLGNFSFGPIRRPELNYPVEIRMGYDSAGRVTVTAKDVRTGDVIEREFCGDREKELGAQFERLSNLEVRS